MGFLLDMGAEVAGSPAQQQLDRLMAMFVEVRRRDFHSTV